MKFFSLTPDVPGELGEHSKLDTSTHPPRVDVFHLDVTDWSGDDLIECFPCFAVTPRLAAALQRAGMSGCSFTRMRTTVNQDQIEQNPVCQVLQFKRLIVVGSAGLDDAGVDASHQLVVSERLWALLQNFSIRECDVSSWEA